MQISKMNSILIIFVVASAGWLAPLQTRGQFLPDSHLGRLVKSIAGSPLLLNAHATAASQYGPTFDSESPSSHNSNDDESDQATYYEQGQQYHQQHQHPSQLPHLAHIDHISQPKQPAAAAAAEAEAQQHKQHQKHSQFQSNPFKNEQQMSSYDDMRNRVQPLQQEPSQQRGIPQRFHSAASSSGRYNSADNDNDDRYENRRAPSSSRPSHEYQMGAYLGPQMDDKELNGVFNSNDERDDADVGGYDDANGDMRGYRKYAASSNSYPREETDSSNPATDGYSYNNNNNNYGGRSSGHSNALPAAYRAYGAGNPSYDDESADEDEGSSVGPSDGANYGPSAGSMRRGRNGGSSSSLRGSLNPAASQSLQHRHKQQSRNSDKSYNNQQANQAQMMTAANGYAPYGYASGPVDLTSILNGMNPNYQMYQAEAYPGQAYYNKQGNPSSSGRNQAASSSQGYNYDTHANQNGYQSGFGAPMGMNMNQARGEQQSQRANRDEDIDGDMDDD